MKPLILIGVFVMIHTTVFSQEYISGKVVDESGYPIPATIQLGNSRDSQMSDLNGDFRILKPAEKGVTMTISFIGQKTVKIENIDTISSPITIVMKNEAIGLGGPDYIFTFVSASIQFDFLAPSFNNFESLWGKENIDNFNKLRGRSFNVEGAVWDHYRKFYFALNIGGSFYSTKLDSANSERGYYSACLFGTNLGYNIINSYRFMITPRAGIRLYKYYLTNFDSNLQREDLEISFSDLVGITGLNFAYKFHIRYYTFSIGFYGGYVFKLNDKPWGYSSNNNRLITDQKTEFANFNFGTSISFLFNLF